MDETLLIQRLRKGEAGAVRELYAYLKPKLKAWLNKQVADERDVEELLRPVRFAADGARSFGIDRFTAVV